MSFKDRLFRIFDECGGSVPTGSGEAATHTSSFPRGLDSRWQGKLLDGSPSGLGAMDERVLGDSDGGSD
jgi:hypothetical protein